NQLIIIPHDILSTLPFEALLCSLPKENTSLQYTNLDYLLLHYDVIYHYSATLWWQSQKDKQERQVKVLKESFVGFAPVYQNKREGEVEAIKNEEWAISERGTRSIQIGTKIYNALLYSEKEVKGIQSAFALKHFSHQTFLHEQATKSNFEAAVKGKKYVLIAAHGFYNKKQPELSGIIFSPNESEQSEEAVLYVNDAYHLDLKQADLVVLSACESGIGKLAKGEGMMAVNRGFLYSGAKNVIFTLFKVYDEQSSQLTQGLFRYILEGKKYAQALRLAKLDLIRQSDADPKAWAGFVMIGG
ncbi:MAG: CHAT domain-containing protein, partial [Chitinophagales bacterium]